MGRLKLTHIHNPSPSEIGDTLYAFLNYLPGPSVVHISGKDSSRCRVVVTLLHANEPSGLRALFHLIKEGFTPLVDTKFVLASVVAARTEPVFTHRMLPGQKDLNRCFSSHHKDLQTVLAATIKKEITRYQAEAVIDLHNTSGSGPSFGVSVSNSQQHLALASHFTHRMIVTDLRLGSLMEQNLNAPVITIEAGGAQDEEAHTTALHGIRSLLLAHDVLEQKQALEVLSNPRRLELTIDATIAYSQSPIDNIDVTMRPDIERFNFAKTKAEQQLGWVTAKRVGALTLDDDSVDIHDFFAFAPVSNTCFALYTKRPLTLFMITTRADIAKSDCLLYFVPVQSS